MRVLTINQMLEALMQAKREGLGERKILIAGDEEGNSFNPCYYAVSEITDDYAYCLLPVPIEEAKKNWVILG